MNILRDMETMLQVCLMFEGASHVFATLKRLVPEESLRSF